MADIARAIGLGVSTTRGYFSETRDPPLNPPLDKCILIGRVLGVHGEWLFSGKGPRLLKATANASSEKGRDNISIVPLIDSVSAGRLTSPASQISIEDVPLLAFADLGPGDFFATRVEGTSMDRISPDGSVIVVNRHERDLFSGRCYVFAYRGETTFKRWQGGDPSYLEPFSTDSVHKPIFVRKKKDLEVIGRVKRTVLDL